jgi:hypothetical protein
MAEDLGPMNGENRSLVTDKMIEMQEFEKKIHHFRGIYRVFLNLLRLKSPIDHNIYLVGLGDTRIWTDYAQKSPWTLPQIRLEEAALRTTLS